MLFLIICLLIICIILFFLTQVIMLYKDKKLERKDFSLRGMLQNLHDDDIAHSRKSAREEISKSILSNPILKKVYQKKKA